MPRHMEVLLSGCGLLILTPVLLVIAAAIRITSPGPVLFRQQRLGRYGRVFELIKFRSMVHSQQGDAPQVTCHGDRRVTPIGRFLRRTKLDELPQLWNVVRGDMSLVGPRPEVPCYASRYPQLFELALQQRPGVTDVCTLRLRDEEHVLAAAGDPERYYVDTLLPRKLAASIREGWRRNLWRDLRVLVATVVPPLTRLAPQPDFRPLASLHELLHPAPRARAAQAGAPSATYANERPLEIELGA